MAVPATRAEAGQITAAQAVQVARVELQVAAVLRRATRAEADREMTVQVAL